MLKHEEYTSGSLHERIEKAAEDNLITAGMAEWAHDVRLDANDERHANDSADMPTEDDANRAIEFVSAFAEYLFVLPAKVRRGMKKD